MNLVESWWFRNLRVYCQFEELVEGPRVESENERKSVGKGETGSLSSYRKRPVLEGSLEVCAW